MAYRRHRPVVGKGGGDVPTAFQLFNNNYDDHHDTASSPLTSSSLESASSSSASSLAAKAIRASSAYRDSSSLSSAYEQSSSSPTLPRPPALSSPPPPMDSSIYESSPKKNMRESRQGFWGVLARKAKAVLDDDATFQQNESRDKTTPQTSDRSVKDQYHSTYDSPKDRRKTDGPALQKGLDAITSSLNYIGGTIGNVLEEGITAVENRTADIIQETRKIQIRKKSGISRSQNQPSHSGSLRQQPMTQTHVTPHMNADLETQLKASRDVAMAMAAKAKLLLRELKTVKADLAFAKERCAQLEDENRNLRESREKGDNPEDDDLIRLQLESLLAEKARLAQENSVYARENRFLREIVEYHQLTMQDVVYLDESNEEVTEVYPMKITIPTATQPFGTMPSHSPTPTVPHGAFTQATHDVSLDSKELNEAVNPYVQRPIDDGRRH